MTRDKQTVARARTRAAGRRVATAKQTLCELAPVTPARAQAQHFIDRWNTHLNGFAPLVHRASMDMAGLAHEAAADLAANLAYLEAAADVPGEATRLRAEFAEQWQVILQTWTLHLVTLLHERFDQCTEHITRRSPIAG